MLLTTSGWCAGAGSNESVSSKSLGEPKTFDAVTVVLVGVRRNAYGSDGLVWDNGFERAFRETGNDCVRLCTAWMGAAGSQELLNDWAKS